MASSSNPLCPILSSKARSLIKDYGYLLDPGVEITMDLLGSFKGVLLTDLSQFCFALLNQAGFSLEAGQSATNVDSERLRKVNTAIVNMMVCRVEDRDFRADTFWRSAAIEKVLFTALVALIYPDPTAGMAAYQALRDEVTQKLAGSQHAEGWDEYCHAAPLEDNYQVLIHNSVCSIRGPGGALVEGDASQVLRELRSHLKAGPPSQSMLGGEESSDDEDESCCSCCARFWGCGRAAEQAPLRGSIQYSSL